MILPLLCTPAASTELLELIAAGGLENLPELIKIIVDQASKAERSKHLKAAHYERTDKRN